MKLHEKIMLLLKSRGYTQKSAANAIGVARITIHRYANGQTSLKSKDFTKLLALLEIDLEQLVSDRLGDTFRNVESDKFFEKVTTVF